MKKRMLRLGCTVWYLAFSLFATIVNFNVWIWLIWRWVRHNRGPLWMVAGMTLWIGLHSALVQWLAQRSLEDWGDEDDDDWDQEPERYPLPPLRDMANR